MAAQFASYPQLTIEERKHLVAETRRYLHQQNKETDQNSNTKKLPRTIPLIQSNSVDVTRRIAPRLDQPLTELAEVGLKRGGYLAWGYTQCGTSFLLSPITLTMQGSYPQLEAGETVTIVGKVHSCGCFSSPQF